MVKVLIIEDDQSIVDSLTHAFKQEGYEPTYALDGKTGKQKFLEEQPDLIVLDLMLPGIKGEEICRFIRSQSEIPIIVISAKDSEVDRVVALELGADDYLTKPFSIRELLIRADKRLRKAATKSFETTGEIYQVGPFTLDTEEHKFKLDGVIIELTPKEFAIMQLFLKRPKRVWTRENLTNAVWEHENVSSKNVDVYVKRLREKLGKFGSAIKTIRGIGYKLEV